MKNNIVFGPVPSRRLGRSLGVDLVPYKTCSMDCVYCESGATTLLTTERKEYIPVNLVTECLDKALASSPELDYITFSGGGEPTLNSGIGKVVGFLNKNYPQYKICLLTNSTLLYDIKVISELRGLDLIIPSLDAVDKKSFTEINAPASGVTVRRTMDGIIKFRHEVPCAMWLEIFIIQNVNDSRESIFEFVSAIREIKPDKVQLNTLDRPGRVHGLKPAEESVIRKFIDAIEPFCPVDAVGKFTYKSVENTGFSVPATETEKRVTELISRRPCTLEDLCFALSAKPGDIEKLIKHLRNMKKLEARESARGIFYYSK